MPVKYRISVNDSTFTPSDHFTWTLVYLGQEFFSTARSRNTESLSYKDCAHDSHQVELSALYEPEIQDKSPELSQPSPHASLRKSPVPCALCPDCRSFTSKRCVTYRHMCVICMMVYHTYDSHGSWQPRLMLTDVHACTQGRTLKDRRHWHHREEGRQNNVHLGADG